MNNHRDMCPTCPELRNYDNAFCRKCKEAWNAGIDSTSGIIKVANINEKNTRDKNKELNIKIHLFEENEKFLKNREKELKEENDKLRGSGLAFKLAIEILKGKDVKSNQLIKDLWDIVAYTGRVSNETKERLKIRVHYK